MNEPPVAGTETNGLSEAYGVPGFTVPVWQMSEALICEPVGPAWLKLKGPALNDGAVMLIVVVGGLAEVLTSCPYARKFAVTGLPFGGVALIEIVPPVSTERPIVPTRSGVFAVKLRVPEVPGPFTVSVLRLNTPFAPL